MARSILWFRQDLRLHDNEALHEALRNSEELIPVYIFDPRQFAPLTTFGTPKTGYARTHFLLQTVADLRDRLRSIGSDLLVRTGCQEDILYDLASSLKAFYIFCNRERTREEVDVQDHLERKLWTIGCEIRYSRGKMLYYTSDLPFPVTHCPDSFNVFRKETEHLIPVRAPLPSPAWLPPFPGTIEPGEIPNLENLIEIEGDHPSYFTGGETAAIELLKTTEKQYPDHFLVTGRLFSPWISLGSLSPKTLYYASSLFPEGGEDIQSNLIYRDYLRLMGKKYGDKIFSKGGIKASGTLFKKDQQLFIRWQKGETGVDIIDAAMQQLNATGWLPDNLRKVVSGYFVKMLNLDWRLGAAYFESRLVDYDPCTNWISWMNIAGLGPDSREDRTVNYNAVGKRIDPSGEYINAWLSGIRATPASA